MRSLPVTGEVFQNFVPAAEARADARAMLIPGELLEHPGPAATLDTDQDALGLGVPSRSCG
jgi:hypothetical protein